MKLWVRATAFTILIPGVVGGLIPYLLSRSLYTPVELGPGRLVGLPVLACGVIFYLLSLYTFVVKGGGTPAIWFVCPLRFLIGEEPGEFVRTVSYRWTRNPMYLGVVLSVFGQALLLDDLSYHLYGAGLWICFHAVVVRLEEPHLKKKYGDAYVEYCRTTPRWIGLPGSKGESPGKE